jgi:hypothetical protein
VILGGNETNKKIVNKNIFIFLMTKNSNDNNNSYEGTPTHLMTGRDFGLVNLRFSCDGSVTYFSAFCLRRRNPVDIESF